MKPTINYRSLAAEFIIVVVGVAVALAADNWRVQFGERQLEEQYISRIVEELKLGQINIQGIRDRYSEAYESASFLVDHIENEGDFEDADLLAEHFTYATRTGATGNNVTVNAVYSEMVSSGRLNLISKPEIRIALINYYRSMEGQSQNLENVPRSMWQRYRQITGREASTFISAGELPTKDIATRLALELKNEPEIVPELNFLRSRLEFHTRGFEMLLEDNSNLLMILN